MSKKMYTLNLKMLYSFKKTISHHLSFQGVLMFLLVEVLPPCRWLLTDQVVVAEGWGGCGNFLK